MLGGVEEFDDPKDEDHQVKNGVEKTSYEICKTVAKTSGLALYSMLVDICCLL